MTAHAQSITPPPGPISKDTPPDQQYATLRAIAQKCEGCELYQCATQTVFGEGALNAHIMMVGEQPGNEEDLAGHPFVGPAGKLLARAMDEAGVRRDDVYVTNAVKHFRFEQRGPRRIHKTPSARNVNACRPWLLAEIGLVKPPVILCLGSTAAKALLGPAFTMTHYLNEWMPGPGNSKILATYHPSAGLRVPDPEKREEIYHAIVAGLKKAQAAIQ